MIKIVTHNAKFHTDDVFAVATLFLLLGKDNCEVIRTRDEALIASGDYVVDVGMVYDPLKNRFDHHQLGGAGDRPNGIPYASFGLVWREFGEKITGSRYIAEEIENSLAEAADAADNGKDIFTPLISGVYHFDITSLVNHFRPTWKEDENWDDRFLECVDWAVGVLTRQIKISKDAEEARKIVIDAYKNSSNKQIISIDGKYDLGREDVARTLAEFPEPLYAVMYRGDSGSWQVATIKLENTFKSRKPLPEAWAAKRDKELEVATGVPGSLFCHRALFMCVADSEEGAIKLAKLALNA